MDDKRPKGKEPKPEELLIEDLNLGTLDKPSRNALCKTLSEFTNKYLESGIPLSNNDLVRLLNIKVSYKNSESKVRSSTTLLNELVKRECIRQIVLITNELIRRNLSFMNNHFDNNKYYFDQIFRLNSGFSILNLLYNQYLTGNLDDDTYGHLLRYYLNNYLMIENINVNDYINKLKRELFDNELRTIKIDKIVKEDIKQLVSNIDINQNTLNKINKNPNLINGFITKYGNMLFILDNIKQLSNANIPKIAIIFEEFNIKNNLDRSICDNLKKYINFMTKSSNQSISTIVDKLVVFNFANQETNSMSIPFINTLLLYNCMSLLMSVFDLLIDRNGNLPDNVLEIFDEDYKYKKLTDNQREMYVKGQDFLNHYEKYQEYIIRQLLRKTREENKKI